MERMTFAVAIRERPVGQPALPMENLLGPVRMAGPRAEAVCFCWQARDLRRSPDASFSFSLILFLTPPGGVISPYSRDLPGVGPRSSFSLRIAAPIPASAAEPVFAEMNG